MDDKQRIDAMEEKCDSDLGEIWRYRDEIEDLSTRCENPIREIFDRIILTEENYIKEHGCTFIPLNPPPRLNFKEMYEWGEK